MRSKEVTQRYADALYDLGNEEGILNELEEGYRLVWKTVKDEENFPRFFQHPLIPDESKFELLDKIFKEQVHSYLLNYLQLLVRKNRESYLGDIFEEFVTIREEREEIVRVRVYTPYELVENGLLDKIKERIKSIFTKEVRIEKILDKSLLAGIKLEVRGKVIDGSLKARLNDLEEKLASEQ